MRRSLFCSFLYLLCSALFVIVLLSLTTAFASAQTPGQTHKSATVSMRSYKGARAIVAVQINGAGAYDFLVDTGATATVVDATLFEELGLAADASVAVHTVAGSDVQVRSSIKEIAVAGLAVQDVRVLRVEKLPLGPEYRGVRGVLGENFLHHFDILIDTQHRKLTLDAGNGLAESLGGERLPITFPADSDGEVIHYRPLVSVSVPDFGSRPLTVLLDSGADNFVLVGGGANSWPKTMAGNTMRVGTVSGSMTCSSSENKLRWGKTSSDLAMLMCQSATASNRDYAGTLPTSAFQQIFVSHAGSYAIVNPIRHAPATQEIAAVAPLAR